MFSSDQKIAEINALKELCNNAQKLNNQEKHLEALLAKQSTLNNRISASRNRTYGSPSNFYEQYMNELKQKRSLANERREKTRHIIFCVILFLLCASLVFTLVYFRSALPGELFVDETQELTDADRQGYIVCFIILACYFSAFMLFYGITGLFWFRLPSLLVTSWIALGYGLPFICFIASIMALFSIHPALISLPIIILAFMIFTRVMHGIGIPLPADIQYTKEERQMLEKYREMDEAEQRKLYAEAYRRNNEAVNTLMKQVYALDDDIAKCQKTIAHLKSLVDHNGYLAADDIRYVEDLVYFMETGRADSLKEALIRLDDKKHHDRVIARQRFDSWMAEQRHNQEMQQLADERESWKREERRRQEREFERREEHRKHVEDTLDDIKRQLEQ